MEPNETVEIALSALKLNTQADLQELLDLSPFQYGDDTSDFQHHQTIDIPLSSTGLFHNEEDISIEKTPKYPEFNLSFSPGPLEPSLYLCTQKEDAIDLSKDTKENENKDSIFIHPQIKDEPLDLTLQFPNVENITAAGSTIKNDFNLEFSQVEASTAAEIISKGTSKKQILEEENPYLIGPSCSRKSPTAFLAPSGTPATNFSGDLDSSSFSRIPPTEFLILNYTQASSNASNAAGTTANTRRNLHSSHDDQQTDNSQIPKSVLLLYETIKKAYSDFSFVYSLGAQMCQERVPMDCFVHFKIGLLLSIASLEGNSSRPPISIVGIGPEFDWANVIMETIADVAERFVGPDDIYKVPPQKKCGPTWIDADPIIMGRGGIYFLGDWTRFRKCRADKYMKIVEYGSVPIEKTNVIYPLEAAIWTHWRAYTNDKKDKEDFNKFIDIFGIPLILEDDNHEVLVDFMLERASVPEFKPTIDELTIGADDMREFLSIVSKRRMDMSKEALDILRRYFVTARMDRAECLSEKSFTILKLFSESFAKLSLRHEVIPIDAISAIYMAENYIQNIFGEGIYPPPKFKLHSYIGAVDEHIVKFQKWVGKYIEKFGNSDS